MLEEMEFMNNINQKEKQGAQTKDGKYVGKENDIRVFGNGKDGRDAVHRK